MNVASCFAKKLNSLVNENHTYAIFSSIVVIASLIPLTIKDSPTWVVALEYATTAVFIFEYIARWLSAGITIDKGAASFLIYPFTPMAIIDLITILPTFILLNQGFKALRIIRLVLILRLFRFVKRSRSFYVIGEVIKRERTVLGVVCLIAVGYIFLTSLILFNVEPDTFDSFFDAIYWACVSLTTVGYGDLYPVSMIGRAIAMVSSLVGIAIIALPAGIITGGYIDVMREEKESRVGADKGKI